MKEKIIKKLSFQDKKKKEDVNEDTHLQKELFVENSPILTINVS